MKRRLPAAPNDVCFSVTKRCNLSCKHCCVNTHTDPNELTFQEICRILKELKEAKVFRIQVFGGEPLLRNDIYDILAKVRELKFGLSLNTNCTLIDEEVPAQFKKLSLDRIATSIDGSNAEIHDRLRGKGAFEGLVRGVGILRKAGIRVGAEAVITKHNLRDLSAIADTAKSIGIETLRLVPVFHGGRAACHVNELAPDEEDFKMGPEILRELKEKHGSFVNGAFHDGAMLIELYKRSRRRKYQRAAKLFVCGAAKNMVAIRSDGVVTPCSAIWDMSAGSLREKSFKDIWLNSELLWQFRNVDKVSLDSIEECRACEYKYFCTGNCRASAYYYSGSITGFTPDCKYFK